jgi:chromosome segregation ATPase
MKSVRMEIVNKLREAEARLESLSKEFQGLESEKQAYLKKIMSGGQLFREVKETDKAIKEKRLAVSNAKKEVSNLRTRLEGQLARFKKDLIQEKQKELKQCMDQRTRYLERIEKLEVEISRYRYLVTGRKDRRLANVKDLLPSKIRHKGDFASVDELIGRIKLEVHQITRMNSEALLSEYLARGEKVDNKR